jgi:hypothetical protein
VAAGPAAWKRSKGRIKCGPGRDGGDGRLQIQERGNLPTFLLATTWVEFRRSLDEAEAFRRLICGIQGKEPGVGPGGAVFEGACPYRGLEV